MLEQQYALVRDARAVLLDHCATLRTAAFTEANSTFGRGSVRNLLVHIGNTYQFWIGKHALAREIAFTEYGAAGSVAEVREMFAGVNALVEDFLTEFAAQPETEIEVQFSGGPRRLSALHLFTHVITHEFHHKGQIMSLSRHLGYEPVDADMIR